MLTAEARQYLPNLELGKVHMQAAESYSNQRVIEILGDITNHGNRTVKQALVTCRLAYAYPDGAAPYFTVLAPVRRGEEVAQWDAIKRAASDAIIEGGGTITHHHAVGRDHMPWYERQSPEPFGKILSGAKAAVDPHGIMNPGVLLPPGQAGVTAG